MIATTRAAQPRGAALCVALLCACGSGPAPREQTATGADKAPPDLAQPRDGQEGTARDPCPSWAALDLAALPALPEGAHVPVFEHVWRTLLQKHFDPTLSCLDWPALRVEVGARVAAAKTRADAYAEINALLDRLGQSHMAVWADDSQRDTDLLARGRAQVPVALALIEGRIVVTRAQLDGRDSGVPTGAIVARAGGRDLEHVAEVAVASARPADSPGARAHAVQSALHAALTCASADERLSLEILDPRQDDAPRAIEVSCYAPERELVSMGNLEDLPTLVEWRMLQDGRTGYLAFNYWMVPMLERVRAGIDELRAQGMAGLIIDLRGNPGGVGAMAVPLARMLLGEAASLGTMRMRTFSQQLNVTPQGDPFAGPVAVLIDMGTASTSEIFVLGMRDLGRVRVVGASNSAGLALPSLIETLPDGGSFQYVVGDYASSSGSSAEGGGIVPDVRVSPTRADYLAGTDPVIEAAVRALYPQ